MAKLPDEITKELDKITLAGVLNRQGFDGVATIMIEECRKNAKSADDEQEGYNWLAMADQLGEFINWHHDL